MENEVINKDNIQELQDFREDIQFNFPKEFENIEPIQRTFETKEQFFEYVKQQNDIISKVIIDYDGSEHMYLFPAYFSFILSFENEDTAAIQQDLEEIFLKLLGLFNEYAYEELGEKGFERIDFNTLVDISSEPQDLEANNLPPATMEEVTEQTETPLQEEPKQRHVKKFKFVKNKNKRNKISTLFTAKPTTEAEPESEIAEPEVDASSSSGDYQEVFPVDNKDDLPQFMQNHIDKQKPKPKKNDSASEPPDNKTSKETKDNDKEDKGKNLIPPEISDSSQNQDVSFSDLYPDIDSEQLLSDLYTSWLDKIVFKSFYKVIFSYRNNYVNNVIVYDDPKFLWDLVKAISSCITHLAIEAQQNPAASLLFETYYDGLVDCLNSVVHAKSEVDVTSAYEHMLSLLNLSIDAFSSELDENSEELGEQEGSFM